MQQAQTARSAWRFFPFAIVGLLVVTVAVNGAMIWQALATFPGQAGRDGFALSNRYNMVLQRADAQASLGWTLRSAVDPKGRTTLTLTDANGQPLNGAHVAATAERPLGAPHATALVFTDHGGGQYVADLVLQASGQWDLAIDVRSGGNTLTVTRRVHVP